MSKNLYRLPKSWAWKKFGDILHVERGGSPRPIDDYITNEPDGINWIKIGDTKNSTKYIYETAEKIKPEGLKKSRLVVEGDFILSNSMSFGKPYIMKTTGCIHDGWLLLRPKNDNLDKEFLYYVLGSSFVYGQFKNKASGTTVKNLNSSLVKDVDVPLPPLEEQRRIVGVLDGLFGKIDKSIALLDESIASASSLMPSALNEVFKEFGIKHEMVAVKQVIMNIQTGTTPSKQIEKYYKVPLEIEWFSPSDFKEEKILHNSKNKLNKIALEERKVKLYDENSLLLVAIGATVGKIGVIREKATSNQQITALKFNNSVNVDFAYYWFKHIKEFIIGQASTATLPIINQNGIKELPFIKVPLDIQTQTVAYLDALHVKADALKKAQEKKKEELLALKASLLESAFKGVL